jgi:hypothetical protein
VSIPVRATPATEAVPAVLPATDDVKTAIAETQTILDLTTPELSAATSVGLRTLRRWHAKPVRPRRHTALFPQAGAASCRLARSGG